jgi:8-oxo-dGTP pyrophosphatase MutT (NUDIX family)
MNQQNSIILYDYECKITEVDFRLNFNETMKGVELKYWDYLDNYDRAANPFLTQNLFLYRFLLGNNITIPNDIVKHFWRRYEKYKRTIPTSGIIIRSQQEIVVVKVYNSDIYGMPKGKHEPNESSLEAALREVKEETGLNFTVNQLENAEAPVLINRTYFYKVALDATSGVFENYNKNEIIDIKWVTFSEIRQTPQNYSKQVLAVVDYLEQESS